MLVVSRVAINLYSTDKTNRNKNKNARVLSKSINSIHVQISRWLRRVR